MQTALPDAPFHLSLLPGGAVWTAFHRAGSGIILRFPGLADFTVSPDGQDVACAPAPDVPADTTEHLYISQVLPLTQSRQGKLVFHASAVETADGAIAFLGKSGRGKSTLAAHFAASGNRFLCDDGLVLEPLAHGYAAQPSHASLRLWDDSRAWLAPDAATAPPLFYTTKARFPACARLPHCDQPRPLRAAFFLGAGTAPGIILQRLSRAQAAVKWLQHSFLLDVEDKALLAGHFERTACLANVIACYDLDYPRRYDGLGAVAKAIVAQATLDHAKP